MDRTRENSKGIRPWIPNNEPDREGIKVYLNSSGEHKPGSWDGRFYEVSGKGKEKKKKKKKSSRIMNITAGFHHSSSLHGWKINLKQRKNGHSQLSPYTATVYAMARYALCMAGTLSILPPVVRQVSKSNIIDYSGTGEY